MKFIGSFRFISAVVGALIIAASFLSPRSVQADIGWPPINPSGASPGVPEGIDTNVRMVAEEVILTIETHERPVPIGGEESPAYWMRGLVEAQFLMRNLGQEAEAFDVWFPLAASVRYHGLLVVLMPENIVQDFKVWVDGLPVDTEQVIAPDVGDPQQESAWARFPMVFPPGQDVIVHVNYTIYPSGRLPFGGFEYILQTGAGWKDSIGQATITVYLPDPVTPENVSMEGNSVEGLPLTPQPSGFTIENNTIRWQLTDFEPTAQDNIFVDVLASGRYRSLMQARARVQIEPESVEAQLELANAIQDALLIVKMVGKHGGGQVLADQANEAYRRALELAPQRADIYSQYASWLLRRGDSITLMRGEPCPAELCELVSHGLSLFPADTELIKIDEQIQMLIEETAPFATQASLDRTATAEAQLTQVAAAQAIQPASSETPLPAEQIFPSPSLSQTTSSATKIITPAISLAKPDSTNSGWMVILLSLGLIAVGLLVVWLRLNRS